MFEKLLEIEKHFDGLSEQLQDRTWSAIRRIIQS